MNIELMERVIAHIEQHPDDLDMGEWARGTTRCFGGWALELCGEPLEWIWYDDRLTTGIIAPNSYDPDKCIIKNTYVRHVRAVDRAKRVLDLTWDQVNELFYVPDEDVVDVAKRLVEEAKCTTTTCASS